MTTVSLSFLQAWWLRIDRALLSLVGFLALCGLIFVAVSTPVLAERHALPPFFYVYRHVLFLCASLVIMMSMSLWQRDAVVPLAWLGFAACFLLLLWVLWDGVTLNGARRWISVGDFVFQPVEFLKPFFIVVSAWLLAQSVKRQRLDFFFLNGLLVFILCLLLALQPDIGQAFLLFFVWVMQCYIACIRWHIMAGFFLTFMVLSLTAYGFFPHVAERVHGFIASEHYQIALSFKSFAQGGIFGSGIGQGVIKRTLPDAHSDFIFAVVAEEMGFLGCIIVMVALVSLMIFGFRRLIDERSLWSVLAVVGFGALICFQGLIHMASVTGLIPTKGMTFPFLSSGGSSLLGLSLVMGLWLCLTRCKRVV